MKQLIETFVILVIICAVFAFIFLPVKCNERTVQHIGYITKIDYSRSSSIIYFSDGRSINCMHKSDNIVPANEPAIVTQYIDGFFQGCKIKPFENKEI